jgi:hypothetical protein
MTTIIATRNQSDVNSSDVPREGETGSTIGGVASNADDDDELPIPVTFFGGAA